jgi:hypothetical protein
MSSGSVWRVQGVCGELRVCTVILMSIVPGRAPQVAGVPVGQQAPACRTLLGPACRQCCSHGGFAGKCAELRGWLLLLAARCGRPPGWLLCT